jgi:CRISPR/Cas system-associated exonuclease Cas4 (RecB family)
MSIPARSPLPPGFQFSQGSLQDYIDCHRRFQLRYLVQLAWPAVESEPVLESERFMQQGARFHRMVQQHLLGISAERLAMLAKDEDLLRWWENYLRATNPSGAQEPKGIFPEVSFSTAIGNFRLVAKYDLVVVSTDGRLVIVDWKTSRRRPRRQWLAERLQTRVYPYVLVQAGAQFLQRETIQPDQVEMVYWFADFPEQPERFVYTVQDFRQDEMYLQGLVDEIAFRGSQGEFELTSQEACCAYCVYRSLCERGVQAGMLEEMPEESDVGLSTSGEQVFLDFEQIAEIEF